METQKQRAVAVSKFFKCYLRAKPLDFVDSNDVRDFRNSTTQRTV